MGRFRMILLPEQGPQIASFADEISALLRPDKKRVGSSVGDFAVNCRSSHTVPGVKKHGTCLRRRAVGNTDNAEGVLSDLQINSISID